MMSNFGVYLRRLPGIVLQKELDRCSLIQVGTIPIVCMSPEAK